MPLVIAPENMELKIVKVLADEKIKKHLESLGLSINSTIEVISRVKGSVVLIVKEGRLALDYDLASKIVVA